MTADITGPTTPRPSGIKRNAMDKRITQIEKELEAIRDDLMELTTLFFTLMPDKDDDSFDLEAEVEREDPLDRWRH